MAAEITINQPTGAGAGVAGKARNDIWLGREVELVSSGTGSTWLWEMLRRPSGSSAVIVDETSQTSTFTGDVVGTYRIKLTTDGTDYVIKVIRIRYDSSGVLANRGWALPAVDEERDEANYGTNDRHWAEVWDTIVEDIRVNGMGGGTLAGDVTGGISSTTVEAIQGSPVSATTPTLGQVLTWSGGDEWAPDDPGGGGTLEGDVTGSTSATLVEAIQGLATPPGTTATDRDFVGVEENSAGWISPRTIIRDGDYAWLGQHGKSGTNYPNVDRLSLPSGIRTHSINLSVGSTSGIRDLGQDDDYVYAACWSNGHIAIISKSTYAVVGWGSLPNFFESERQATSVCADNAGNFYVIGVSRTPITVHGIFKFSTAACLGASPNTVGPTLSVTGAIYAWNRRIIHAAGYLWVTRGGSTLAPMLIKVDPVTLTTVAGTVSTNFGMNVVYNDSDSNIYVTDNTDNKLHKINPADCSILSSANLTGLLSDPDGFAFGVVPDDLTPIAAVTGSGSGDGKCVLVDTSLMSVLLSPTLLSNQYGDVIGRSNSPSRYDFFFTSIVSGAAPGVYRFEVTSGGTNEELLSGGPAALVYKKIDRLQGFLVAPTTPTSGQLLTWGEAGYWEPASPSASLTGYTDNYDTSLGTGGRYIAAPGDNCTVIGSYAGYNLYYGAENTAVGVRSQGTADNGGGNTSVGYRSLYGTLGSYNTVVGWKAGENLTSGSNNTILGAYAFAAAGSSVREIVIGYDTTGKGSDQTVIGRTAQTDTWIRGNTLHVGSENAADKFFYFQKTASGVQPGFKWLNGSSKLQWSNDGTNYYDQGTAFDLKTATGVVSVSAATAPTVGQVLTATSGTVATWQTAGGGSLTGITSGASSYQTALGFQAGTSGTYTANVGYQAGQNATTAIGNVNIGAFAGRALTTTPGDYNINIGYEAGLVMAGSTSKNVCVGLRAGNRLNGTAAVNNVCIGLDAGRGVTNDFSGIYIGRNSGYTVRGDDIVCIGSYAGGAVGLGTNNANTSVLIGNYAGGNGYGMDDIGIGTYALYGQAGSSSDNVAIGHSAGYYINTGTQNVCIGYSAGQNIAAGNYNIFLGSNAGTTATVCNNLICIGNSADVAADFEVNEIAIGYGAIGKGSHTTVIGRSAATATTDTWLRGTTCHIGNEAAGAVTLRFETTDQATRPGVRWSGTAMEYSDGGGVWATFASLSDIKLKANIEPLQHGIDFINALRPRIYDWKSPTNESMKRKQMGFVAQELKEDVNKQGLEGGVYRDDSDNWSIDYNQLVAPLVKAVQELSAQVADLKKELATLKAAKSA